jgi:hypothetical protein
MKNAIKDSIVSASRVYYFNKCVINISMYLATVARGSSYGDNQENNVT